MVHGSQLSWNGTHKIYSLYQLIKVDSFLVVHTRSSREGSVAQDHLWLHSKFEANRAYMKSSSDTRVHTYRNTNMESRQG